MSNIEFAENFTRYTNAKEYDETYKSYTGDLKFIDLALGDWRIKIVRCQQRILEFNL